LCDADPCGLREAAYNRRAAVDLLERRRGADVGGLAEAAILASRQPSTVASASDDTTSTVKQRVIRRCRKMFADDDALNL